MSDGLLRNLHAFAATVAAVPGGRRIVEESVDGFVSSSNDGFLNHLFVSEAAAFPFAAQALGDRPAFVWAEQQVSRNDLNELPRNDWSIIAMAGMNASTLPHSDPQLGEAQPVVVRRDTDFNDWHQVYCEVFGADLESAAEWRTLFEALGPGGDDSLVLLLARHAQELAACGSAYILGAEAGLYSFATRVRLRRRGFASALVHAAHHEARARGAITATLEARPEAVSIYERAGYNTERMLQLVTFG